VAARPHPLGKLMQQRSLVTGGITAASLVFLVAPLAVVVLFSFHETAALSFPFTGFSLRWYEEVLSSAQFAEAAKHSAVIAVAVSAVTLLLGSAAAYGLSRASSGLKAPLALLFFLPITLPGLFLGLALLVFFAGIELKLSLLTVAIGHFVYVFPYFLLIAKAALDRLDMALEEAAADLGAGPWAVFRRVTLPQVWPVLVGATSLAFALSFDEFVITFFTIGSQSTLPLYIWSGLRRTIDPTVNTISTLLMLVTLVLFVLAFVMTLRGRTRASAAPAVPA
jgi:ABC-type spermidine/putrescine transport system permease subunit II